MKTHSFTSIMNITTFRVELGNKLQLAARLHHIFVGNRTSPNMYDFLSIEDFLKFEGTFKECVKERILKCPSDAILFIDAEKCSKRVGIERSFNVRSEDFIGFFEKQALKIQLEATLVPSSCGTVKRMKI